MTAAFSVLPLLLDLFVGGLQCDDHCDSDSSDWHEVPGSWQWHMAPILGGAVFVAGTCLAVFVRRRRRFAAGVSLLAGLAALTTLAAWSGAGLDTDFVHLGMNRFLLLVGPVFLAALAVFLTESQDEDSR